MANNSYSNVTLQEPSRFKISTQYFSPHDLNLFIESLETIQRLTIEKEERKEQEKVKQMIKKTSNRFCSTLARICSESTLDRSTGPSADEGEDETLLHLENKKVPSTPDSQRSQYDETYFSAPNSNESSPRNSVIYKQKLSTNSSGSSLSINISSDSEESGVFPIGRSTPDLFEPQNTPIRPRSKAVTKTRSLSTRSRLIGLVLKKESAKTSGVQLISCRALDEYETLEMYEQEQQLQQQQQQHLMNQELQAESDKLKRFSTLHMKKKSRQGFTCPDGSSEERFLDKALRYLTL